MVTAADYVTKMAVDIDWRCIIDQVVTEGGSMKA
jgi:hypothetical protein